MRNLRTWGYIADIPKNASENTKTPYQLTAVARIVHLRGGGKQFSLARARAPAFTSNCLCTSDVAIQ